MNISQLWQEGQSDRNEASCFTLVPDIIFTLPLPSLSSVQAQQERIMSYLGYLLRSPVHSEKMGKSHVWPASHMGQGSGETPMWFSSVNCIEQAFFTACLGRINAQLI